VSIQPAVDAIPAIDPQPIVDAATGFMRAKHLFVASEIGVFEALARGPKSLAELARELKIPTRTARIVIDAVTALGFLVRDGDHYGNAPVAQAFLSGHGAADFRPFIRFWNRISFRRWQELEDSVRLGHGVAGEFSFSAEEQRIFSEGVEGFTQSQAIALVKEYDFTRHRKIADLGGGTGSFLQSILERYPKIQATLFELPGVAAVAREKLRGTSVESRIGIIEGDLLKDSLPPDHDVFLVANVVHGLDRAQNQALFRRVREKVKPGARFLLVDFWTNLAHTEPLFAALMAGEFLVIAGNGDVYSVDEGRAWLEEAGWRFVAHKPLDGPSSLVIAEAAGS
jgi:ubiquinone/menaquinone biosynthesis C-methylase UbiE